MSRKKNREMNRKYGAFLDICRMSQDKLKKYLVFEMAKYGYDVIADDGYIYCKEINMPVLLTAHMDTVHKQEPRQFIEKVNDKGNHVLSSPQGIGGDDRCGIFMILSILRETDYRPAVLFCEDEEIGGVGSSKFTTYKENVNAIAKLKFFIELDRANANDLVFYDDGNEDFYQFCIKSTGYKENFGSFSDISILSPDSGVSSVNISCGYYHAHTPKEEVVWEEMLNSIKVTEKLIEASKDVEQFEYVEIENYKYLFDSNNYSVYGGYNSGWYNSYSTSNVNTYTFKEVEVVVEWMEGDRNKLMYYCGTSVDECLGMFFQDNPDVCFNDIISYYET